VHDGIRQVAELGGGAEVFELANAA